MTEIFVGSVGVSVVPDLRGFNDTMRRDLVPAANDIGQEIGKEISRGIVESLDIGGAVSEASTRDRARIEESGYSSGLAYGSEMRRGIDESLRDITATVTVKADTTLARAEIDRLNGTITQRVRTTGGNGGGSLLGSGAGGGAGIAGAGAGGGAAAAALAASATGPEGAGFTSVAGGVGLAAAGAAAFAGTAALVAFIGQAVAGAVVAGFGAGLAGLAIYGAAQYAPVTKAFDTVKTDFTNDLKTIGAAFVPVLVNIAGAITGVLRTLTPVFKAAAQTIAAPFQAFADALIRAFGDPQVKASIQAVATAFGAILTALKPQIPGIVNSIANGIKAIADAVSKNPQAFADFIKFLSDIVVWSLFAIAGLTNFADWLEARFVPDIINVWNSVYNNTVGNVVRTYDAVTGWLDKMVNYVNSGYDTMRHDIASTWDLIWDNTVGREERGAADVRNVLTGMRNWIISFFSNAGSWLYGAGKAVIQGFWNGMTDVWREVTGWISGLAGWIKAHKGPYDADLGLLQPAGRAIMAGLRIGLLGGFVDIKNIITGAAGDIQSWLATSVGQDIFGRIIKQGLIDVSKLPSALVNVLGKIGGFASSIWHKVFGGGSGVGQWAGTVAQALALLGLPESLGSQVLYQMQTESGGNPNAQNLTAAGIAAGGPKGLLQVVGGTFAAYHVPGTSGNIFDPLANIAAALNYARNVYGPTLMRGGMGLGSGKGYDAGGWVPPGLTLFANGTGEPELAVPMQALRDHGARQAAALEALSSIGGPEYHAHFDGLTGQAIESHVRTAFTAMSIQQGNMGRQGRRR